MSRSTPRRGPGLLGERGGSLSTLGEGERERERGRGREGEGEGVMVLRNCCLRERGRAVAQRSKHGREADPEAGALDGLEELLGDDHVRVHVLRGRPRQERRAEG